MPVPSFNASWYTGSAWAMASPFHVPSSWGPGRQRMSQNDSSHLEKFHMVSSWAPERMNSCMSWRLRQTVIVQNSLGPATMLAHRTTSPVSASWRRTRRVARIMCGKYHGARRRERVVTVKRSPAAFSPSGFDSDACVTRD